MVCGCEVGARAQVRCVDWAVAVMKHLHSIATGMVGVAHAAEIAAVVAVAFLDFGYRH